MKRVLFTLIAGLLSFQLYATHIIGGELYYDCLGGNTYRITLKVYRDCYLGQAAFDAPAKVTVFNGNGGFMQVISIPFPGSAYVPFISSNPCFQAPPNVCVEEAVYQTVVSLPGSPSGYIFAYQRCCRNNTIVNLVDPGNTGATYTEQVPVADLCNSSPRFTSFPPIALCVNEPLIFDHSATDPDGDSLVYQLCTTYDGATPNDPAPGVASNPPFPQITFQSPYNSANPIASNPQAIIDPVTGILTVNPTQLGQYVVGVCVSEYRNGVLIGTHSRDFQFNVTNCLSSVQSEAELPDDFTPVGGVFESCDGLTIPFENLSTNSSYYYWDFGVTTIISDTSSLEEPVYTYPSTGIYTVMLVANPGYFCADTDYVTIHVRELMDVDFTPDADQCIDLNSFDFIPTGIIPTGTQFSWNFGANAIPVSSTNQSQLNVTYSQYGIYPVTLAADYEGCLDTAIHEVKVYGHPQVSIDVDSIGCVPFTAQFNTTVDAQLNTLVYDWNLGNGIFSSLQNPQTVYWNVDTYSVNLTVISLTGCKDTIVFNKPDWIEVYPVPNADFTVEPLEQSIFYPVFYITDHSTNDVVDCWMDYDDGNFVNDCSNGYYTYADTGYYDVTQYVYNTFMCPDTMIVRIRVKPEFVFNIPNTFTPNWDAHNEGFRGKGIGIKEYDFRVYDRWGRTLFQTNDQLAEWNGCLNNQGIILPEDIYVYSVDIVDVFDEKHHFAGKVFLFKSVPSN